MTPSLVYKISGQYDATGEKQAEASINGFAKGASAKINTFTNNIKNSTNGIASLCKSITGFSNAIPAIGAVVAVVGLAVGAVRKVKQAINECENEFAQAELGSVRFGMAVKNSTKLGSDSLEHLTAFAEKFSKTTLYSTDDIVAQEAYLAGLNLTEEQIKKTMEAAVNYQAFTGGDLSSAVQTLAKTYTGTAGELGKTSKEFKSLTKAQLENGAAIDLVNQKYKGYSSTIATMTLSGREAQWKKTSDDIKQSIGSVFGSLKYSILGKTQPIFDGFKDGLSTFNTGLINVFKNLPEVASLTAQMVWEAFITILKPSTWINAIKSIFTGLSQIIPDLLNGIVTLIVDAFTLCVTTVKNIFVNLGTGLKAIFVDAINVVISGINKAIDVYNKLPTAAKLITGGKDLKIIATIESPKLTTAGSAVKDFENGIGKLGSDYKASVSAVGSDIKDTVTDVVQPIADATKDTRDKLGEILTQTTSISDEASKAISGTSGNTESAESGKSTVSTAGNSVVQTAEDTADSLGILKGALQELGEMGQFATSVMTIVQQGIKLDTEMRKGEAVATEAASAALKSSIIGLIIELIVKLCNIMTEKSSVFSEFMNGITSILSVVADILLPIMEEIIKPFCNTFKTVGTIIGALLRPLLEIVSQVLTPIANLLNIIIRVIAPILNMFMKLGSVLNKLNPIMDLFTAALSILGEVIKFLYNKILVPVINFILLLISGIGNFFIAMYNGIISVLNSISIFGWHPFDFDSKGYINYDSIKLSEISDSDSDDYDYDNDTDSTNDSTSSGSSSASYTAAKDTYVNIYFNNSYVNGDAREIAIMLNKEIQSAEKLGYC